MAYNAGGAFGGFPGGYNVAAGAVVPNAVVPGVGAPVTLGANLPAVDPNNFAGTVHFGPSTTTIVPSGGQVLPGGVVYNPNVAPGF